MASIYLKTKDTLSALKIIDTAVLVYPNNVDLSNKQINYYIVANKKAEVISKLQKAIANDPKNKQLYFNAGILYTQSKDIPSAIAAYKKAVEVDPDYYEANMNLGYLIMNPAIDLVNKANKLPSSKQKEYDADMAQASTMFDQAKPYLVKATQINPKSIDAWQNLRTYYLGKRDDASAAAVNKTIAALKAQGGN